MSTATKDQRVTDLFTEGRHHRNLSVIAINQHLYYSKDPTQRRNCHYIALFNNPVDQQPVVTLARQMYPGRTQMFMDTYEKAVAKPFGYLLVDLKPTTTTDQRLVPNGLTKSEIISNRLTMPDTGSDGYRTDSECEKPNKTITRPPQRRSWIEFCGSSSEEECAPPQLRRRVGRARRRLCRRIPCPECGLVIRGAANFTSHVLREHTQQPWTVVAFDEGHCLRGGGWVIDILCFAGTILGGTGVWIIQSSVFLLLSECVCVCIQE